ncbi:ComF family protein [Candidatus Spongiihabitans sp.]|uniref:ComF family protein n=1 Tax=Candidatus Spongiihabitans sp. TaxID=3101308 RepID=UPI003C7DE3E4
MQTIRSVFNRSILSGSILSGPLDYLLPEKCALCRCISDLGFCINCQQLLPWTECACEICSVHLSEPGVCGHCQDRRPVYQDSMIPFRYQSPISDQIQALKYSGQLSHAVAMGKMLSLWAMKNPAQWPDTIVPMPLHRNRIIQRGFNQATEIARVLNKQLGIPIDQTLLKRVKNTVTQTGLHEKMRRQNVRKAFVGKACAGKNPTSHRHVALLDDVVTSGNTVNAAAKALIGAGVERVSVWAIAKT